MRMKGPATSIDMLSMGSLVFAQQPMGKATKNRLEMVDVPHLCTRLTKKATSSTAQGGGGSFKNRKPIGEVGCCESGMAKRIH